MGVRNYLVEGVSGSGKTSVCDELQRRGYCTIHGDRELAYQGDPMTGEPVDPPAYLDDEGRARFISEHHIWHVEAVRAMVADRTQPITFFCGGSRNFACFIDLFDGVFVLDIDASTLRRRLDQRPEDDWGGNGRHAERDLITELHHTKAAIPQNGTLIDATVPLSDVVDKILRLCELDNPTSQGSAGAQPLR